jgi:4-amino-4-deoxy-L-arabinose transferase-like glycosyltransferase
MKKVFKHTGFLITFIVIFAFVIRVWGITSTPPSLNWDEISLGYNAYSILQTGKDEWGVTMPTLFRAYGDYKLPVYIYTSVPSIAYFGLNEFGVRFPSVVAGTLTVLFTYLLVREVFIDHKRKDLIGLTAATLVSLEPWTFFLSRGAFEANLALFLISAGAYCFFRSLRTPHYLFPASLFWGLSVWTYNSARLFVPLFIVCLVVLYSKQMYGMFKRSKYISIASAIIIFLFIAPMIVQLTRPDGQARFLNVSIIDEGAISTINESRRVSRLPSILSRVRYNKVTYFTKVFVKNFISHYSNDFLYLRGGNNHQFNVQNYGLLYSVNTWFLLAGIILALVSKKKTIYALLIWLFLGALASSLTLESPHTLRSITMLPIPMILTAYGIYSSINFLYEKTKIGKRNIIFFVILYAVFLLVPVERYFTQYFKEYPQKYSQAWQYGYKEVSSYIQDSYSQYDKIIITKKYGEPHEFLLFYLKWDPTDYLADENLNRFSQSNWWWVDGFDKFVFVNEWQMKDNLLTNTFITESKQTFDCTSIRCLVISTPVSSPTSWTKKAEIKFLDEKTAFEIYEN